MRIQCIEWIAMSLLVLLTGCGGDPDRTPVAPGGGPSEGATNTETIAFADSSLEAAVREALGLQDRPISLDQAAALGKLECRERGVTSIEGIEQLTGLTVLDLAGNLVVSIDPVAALDSLVLLDVTGNRIWDVSALVGLIQLQALVLDGAVDSMDNAEKLADDMLAAHAEYLPRFT